MDVTSIDRRLLAALEDGLPLESRPYAALAREAGLTEAMVLERLKVLLAEGTIRRFGVIVRHHELGYRANAMVVWDVLNQSVAEAGQTLAKLPYVTLCYRRPRRLPAWPYNLFCMIHGRDRAAVDVLIDQATESAGLRDVPRSVLFSRRRFKQRGARYSPATQSKPEAA